MNPETAIMLDATPADSTPASTPTEPTPGQPRHILRNTAIACAAAAAVGWFATGHWSTTAHAAKPASAQVVPVTTVRVGTQDVAVFRTGVGTASAPATVTVKSRIDGQLEKVGFSEGQEVKAGQLLAQLDDRTLQAQLAQAQAQKARDAAQLANARADLQRYTTLLAQDAATHQQRDTQAALVNQLAAAVQTDDAQIQLAQVQLSFTRIQAPISGRLGARLVDPGNIVHATDATGLVVINQVDPINVSFTLPEDTLQDIHRAQQDSKQPLQVQAFDRSGNTLLGTGELAFVNNQIDTATGTVQLKARFANPKRDLWPGQYVNVRLQLGQHSQALTLPAAAIQRGQDGTYVYVVQDDDTAAKQNVKVAQIADNVAVVSEGLQASQRVVLDGQYKLRPGISVTEVKHSAPVDKAKAEKDAKADATGKTDKADKANKAGSAS